MMPVTFRTILAITAEKIKVPVMTKSVMMIYFQPILAKDLISLYLPSFSVCFPIRWDSQ